MRQSERTIVSTCRQVAHALGCPSWQQLRTFTTQIDIKEIDRQLCGDEEEGQGDLRPASAPLAAQLLKVSRMACGVRRAVPWGQAPHRWRWTGDVQGQKGAGA